MLVFTIPVQICAAAIARDHTPPNTIALLRQHRGTEYLPSAQHQFNRFFYVARDHYPNTKCGSTTPFMEFNAHSNAELMAAYTTIGRDPNVVAVIGVSTSKEALLVEPLSKQYQLLTVSVDVAFVDKHIPASTWRIDQVIQHLKAAGVKRVVVAAGGAMECLQHDPLCTEADAVIEARIPACLDEM